MASQSGCAPTQEDVSVDLETPRVTLSVCVPQTWWAASRTVECTTGEGNSLQYLCLVLSIVLNQRVLTLSHDGEELNLGYAVDQWAGTTLHAGLAESED